MLLHTFDLLLAYL